MSTDSKRRISFTIDTPEEKAEFDKMAKERGFQNVSLWHVSLFSNILDVIY